MRRLVVIAAALWASLGCDPSWEETVKLDEKLDRGEVRSWDVWVSVGAETAAVVLEDGGELTLSAEVEARYPYLLGPVGRLGMTLESAATGPVTFTDQVPHRRVSAATLRLVDLLALSCGEFAACGGSDTAEGWEECPTEPCEVAARLTLTRGEEPGKLRTWIEVKAALDPAWGFDRPSLRMSVIPR